MRHHVLVTITMFLLVVSSALAAKKKPGNDGLFPPAPAAAKAIRMDGRGFIIHGERVYIASGSIHYPRVPHELWRDRLLRAQRAGFNTVETYAFWNFHEPREKDWNFSGDADMAGFFQTAQDLGMYAIARVGPYVCAEWDSGGWPVWLKFKPGFDVRSNNPEFLKWNDHWYEKILPIVAARQIHRGGNVILVQLENEHPKGWGAITEPKYFQHLKTKAESLGIEVPHFMSGLNHGHTPVPGNPDTSGRKTPWLTTEFWPGWFNLYGNLAPQKLRQVDTAHWKIIARGGAGQNFYMLHGGTNFETWNDDSGAASYDYGAAIGQCGDLRPAYYRMKRANLFATSFANLLGNANDATAEFNWIATGVSLAGVRASPEGKAIFLENTGNAVASATFKNGDTMRLNPGEIAPIVYDAIIGDAKVVICTARVVAVARHDKTVTLIVAGMTGDAGTVRVTEDGTEKEFSVAFPADAPAEQMAGSRVRLLSMDSTLADRTWIVGAPGKQYVVCGPDYVGEFSDAGGKISMQIERPFGRSVGDVFVFGAEAKRLAVKSNATLDSAPAPVLGDWQVRAAPEASAAFDDAGWRKSENPQQMGADGDISAFAWYRAIVDVGQAGAGMIQFANAADNLVVCVNGRRARVDGTKITAEFQAGRNVIAVLTSHRGRDKAFNYLGALPGFHRKGLFGLVNLSIGGATMAVKNWKMRGGAGAVDGDWKSAAAAAGPAFYRATFTTQPSGVVLRATFKGLSRGTMWLNGHNLGRYPEKLKLDGLWLPECWLKSGENTLVIFDEEGASPGQVKLRVETAASREVIRVREP